MRQLYIPLLAISLFLTLLDPVKSFAADQACQEEQELLGLSVAPLGKQSADAPPSGLIIADILPLSQGARIGLRKGDIIEQINSWRAQSCNHYSHAVQDAHKDQKAILLLVSRKGSRQTLAFGPEIWIQQEQEKQEKQAVETLQTMLAAPLPTDLKAKVGDTGGQALSILRDVDAATAEQSKPDAYEEAVSTAQTRLRALDQASQGEAEKRIVAGAKVLLAYYLTARDIRQYKQDFVKDQRKDLRKGRAAAFQSPDLPYFLASPVPQWIDRYPFLRASVSETPQVINFLETPGHWDPDKAVDLLWQHAKAETDRFAQWLQGQTLPGRAANTQPR